MVNQPTLTLPELQLHKLPNQQQNIRIGVKTRYANGTHAVHVKRANEISHQLIQHLNSANNKKNVTFFSIGSFDDISRCNYDYLFQLYCKRPEHISKKNKALMMLGWPATISVLASPLGLTVLSLPGLAKESAVFDWQMSLVPKHYEQALCLKKKNMPQITSTVSASGWGTSEDKLEQSYINTESHVIASATQFLNDMNWNEMNEQVRQYAKTHDADQKLLNFAEKTVSKHSPASLPSDGHDRILPSLGSRYAVIIGISQYQYASDERGLNNLLYADDDARAIDRILKQKGWPENHIKLLVNEEAKKRNVDIALESWLTKANENDIILFFWAGHAYPDPANPEKIYFACYDTDITIPATGLRMDHVRSFLEERRARNTIVIADTCHAGKLVTRGKRGIAISPYLNQIKQKSDIPKGWVFIVGAESDRKAIEDSSWEHGAFTYCLLNALQGEADGYESAGPTDNAITLGEIRAYMNSSMPDKTLQALGVAKHPIITTSTGDPAIWDLPLLQ